MCRVSLAQVSKERGRRNRERSEGQKDSGVRRREEEEKKERDKSERLQWMIAGHISQLLRYSYFFFIRYKIELSTGEGIFVDMKHHICSKGVRQRNHQVQVRFSPSLLSTLPSHSLLSLLHLGIAVFPQLPLYSYIIDYADCRWHCARSRKFQRIFYKWRGDCE